MSKYHYLVHTDIQLLGIQSKGIISNEVELKYDFTRTDDDDKLINICGLPSFISKTCLHVVENVSRQDSVDISWDLWQTLEICQNRIQATETTNINLQWKQSG